MNVDTHKKTRKLKGVLLLVILVSVGVTVLAFVQYRRVLKKHDALISVVQSDANITIGKVHQTATRNGVTEWRLDAGSAQYMDAEKQAVFKDLSVTFYLKDNSQVYLTADRGILKTDTNNIEVMGNVVMKNKIGRLNTENLYYEHKRRVIFSSVPVKIVGDSFDLAAGTMSLNLDTNQTLLEGNVDGIFSEKIRL